MILRTLISHYVGAKVRENMMQQAGDKLQPAQDLGGMPLQVDVALVFALSFEANALVEMLQDHQRGKLKDVMLHLGEIAGARIAVIQAGAGRKKVETACRSVLPILRPKWVISCGFGGGLTEAVKLGDLMLVDDVVHCTGWETTGQTDAMSDLQTLSVTSPLELVSPVSKETRLPAGWNRGRLATVDALVRGPADRNGLAASTSASCCDMETYAVAEYCQKNSLPCMGVRIISDAADEQLSPAVEKLLETPSLAGKLGVTAAALWQKPSTAKELWSLYDRSDRLSRKLAKMLKDMVPSLT